MVARQSKHELQHTKSHLANQPTNQHTNQHRKGHLKMADEEFDPWVLSSGLAEKYTGTVKDATFGFKADYQDGTRLLFMVDIQTDDSEIGDNGLVTEQYPVGDGWDVTEKGLKCKREDGKRKGFNKNSGYGQLVAAAVEAGAGGTLKERGGADGPMRADIWNGLTFDFERKEFKGNFDGQDRTWARMLPVKMIDGGKATAADSGSAKPTEKAAEAPTDTTPSTNGNGAKGGDYGLDAGLLAKIKMRAKKANTHDEFIELCFGELADSLGSAGEDVVMDADGLYAEVKG